MKRNELSNLDKLGLTAIFELNNMISLQVYSSYKSRTVTYVSKIKLFLCNTDYSIQQSTIHKSCKLYTMLSYLSFFL